MSRKTKIGLALGLSLFLVLLLVTYFKLSKESFVDPAEDLCLQAKELLRKTDPKFSVCNHPILQQLCPTQCSFTNNAFQVQDNCTLQKSLGRCQRLPTYMAQQCPSDVCHTIVNDEDVGIG